MNVCNPPSVIMVKLRFVIDCQSQWIAPPQGIIISTIHRLYRFCTLEVKYLIFKIVKFLFESLFAGQALKCALISVHTKFIASYNFTLPPYNLALPQYNFALPPYNRTLP